MLLIQSKKTDYNTKISEIEKKENATDHDHDKYITMEEFNKLAAESFTARLAQANLLKENNLANFVKKTDFNYKLKDLNKNESNDLTEKVKAISMIG